MPQDITEMLLVPMATGAGSGSRYRFMRANRQRRSAAHEIMRLRKEVARLQKIIDHPLAALPKEGET